jgi:hypothetical protein
MVTAFDRPASATHVVEAKTRPRFVKIMDKCKISQHTIINPPIKVPYTYNIETCIEALPIYVHILVRDILEMRKPVGWDPTTPVNIIIAIERSVTFVVGYHSRVASTADEDILLQGGRWMGRW